MNPSNQRMLQNIHQLYCSLTHLDIPWSMERLWPWECFCARFTEDDLRTVVTFMRDKERNHKPVRSLAFRNFISGPDSLVFFEEDLAEARVRARMPKRNTDRASVLRSTGRMESSVDTARSAAQIIAADKAFQTFRELKQTL